MKKKIKDNVSHDTVKVLNRKLDSLKNFVEFSTLISSKLDFSELMTLVMEKAKLVMDAEACSILFYNSETNKLEFEIAISEEEKTSEILKKKIILDMGQGIAGWVAKHSKPLLVENVQNEPRFFKDISQKINYQTKSILCVPLMLKGKTILAYRHSFSSTTMPEEPNKIR